MSFMSLILFKLFLNPFTNKVTSRHLIRARSFSSCENKCTNTSDLYTQTSHPNDKQHLLVLIVIFDRGQLNVKVICLCFKGSYS